MKAKHRKYSTALAKERLARDAKEAMKDPEMRKALDYFIKATS